VIGTHAKRIAPALLALAVSVLLVACGGGDNKTSSSATTGASNAGGKAATIGLLLPETKTARYEAHDKPVFQAKVKALCPNCKQLYQNASQDAQKQLSQAEAMLAAGADVLVLDAVDVGSVGPIIKDAKQKNVPVIAYDRLISDQQIAYYVSFDNVRQGRIQAQALIDKVGSSKPLVMINGAPTDPSAGDYKKGAHQVLDKSAKIVKEYDTPDWSPDKAQQEMDQAITAVGKTGFKGVYAMNDGTAGGAIAAMQGAGIDPKTIPTTGQDAELEAIQRILTGDQFMTVYKATKPESEAAAKIAVALANGDPVPPDLVTGTTNNEATDVPSVLLTPLAVTKDNVADATSGGQPLIGPDGYWTVEDICTPEFKSACDAAGLS
jgi:D-xylose transport system substrate-binding protein